ncbi:MAG: response regulator [Candidatus Eisenbacteria bacterium]
MARILIVDDDEQVRTMLRITFEEAGYEAGEAPDGSAAIRRQRENPADLVITDLIMPEKEGLETIMDLRKEWPGARIIAISGGGRLVPGDYLLHARRLGANRVFRKPIDRKKLLGAVRELLEEAAATGRPEA